MVNRLSILFSSEKIHNNNLIINLFVIIVIYLAFLDSPIDLLNFISPVFVFLFSWFFPVLFVMKNFMNINHKTI